MKIKHNYVLKKDVQFCTEKDTLQQVLDRLNETNYRCIPVLNDSGTHFLGNIYKIDILEHIMKNKKYLTESVLPLVSNKSEFIHEESSFFKAFLSIRKYPYLAVLNERNEFMGILTHSKVMDLLEDSFGAKKGNYTLTIGTSEYKGALTKLLNIVKKYANVEGIMSLDTGDVLIRRILLSLPGTLTHENIEEIRFVLERHGFRVVHIDQF